MRKAVFLALTLTSTGLFAQLKSPEQFLGYKLGERFTRHYKVVEYVNHVAQTSPNVKIHQYGETYEHRALVSVLISSPENIDNWDNIRQNNLIRAKMIEGRVSNDNIAIVWLSYNIHGNEASSTEASMKTIYELATADRAKEWMKNTVVIMDPGINPDGRDRYVNFYNQYGNKHFNPNGDAMEHREPWPGGRPNHYLFDLNRDWAWQTQQESVSRMQLYNEVMPHIHVDFHEQGYNSPYYFAPAAEPYHEVITPWQREFQITIGKNHAKYFDEKNWLYFTKERFDLLYPSYGDTYPTYNGAIGMTYEQAGHGFAGLGIITEYGDTLTLKNRIDHHYTTGISTVEISSQNASKLTSEFEAYFEKNVNNPDGKYKSYIVKGSNNPDKMAALTRFLDKQKIKYGTGKTRKAINGFSYLKNGNTSVSVGGGDLVINTYQPKSKLVTALFEPMAKLSDTLTYDITAWSLPYAYGLDAYALTEKVTLSGEYKLPIAKKIEEGEKPYAYISKYNSLEDVKWLTELIKAGLNLRIAHKPVTLNGKTYQRGSIVATRRTNEKFGPQFDKIIQDAAKTYARSIDAVYTGFADSGVDLGSGEIAKLETPKIAVLSGEQTSSLGFGEVWHFFEQQINYPITVISTSYFSRINLDDYNVLIVPNGRYRLFDEAALSKLSSWISDGGKLLLIGNALRSFAGKNGFILKDPSDEEKKNNKENENGLLKPFDSYERDGLSSSIFGAIFKVSLDNSNPLAYGYGKEYYSLKTSSQRFAYLDGGQNIGVLKGNSKPVSGFAGFKALNKLENSLVFGVQQKGRGQVVYFVDNPLFRAFWENGKLLFSNAVFIVGNL
ncbi:MAG: M14 family metallopeptidase [Bacteroidota bacterium]